MYFKILETKNSEANERKVFTKKCTFYTPDFFIIFFYTTLIIFSSFLDLFLAIFLYTRANLVVWVLFLTTSYFRLIVEFILDIQSPKSSNAHGSNFFLSFFKILLIVLGLHSILISAEILTETLENPNNPNEFSDCTTYPFFHISHENLSLIKFYCYIYLGSKSIPQLFIMSVFIGMSRPTGIFAYMSTANIVLNMVLFSFTISLTFPIRKKPRVFDNFMSLIFSAFNKFLATLCGCCVNMLVFMVTYRHVKFYAFLAHFLKTVIWVLPCQALLSSQPVSRLEGLVLLAFFPVIFSFIFVHPFEKTWRLFYFLSYLICSILDLAFLGVWADAELLDLSFYSTLRIVQIAFLSLFGMINSIKRGVECEFKEKKTENNVNELKDEQMDQATNSNETKS